MIEMLRFLTNLLCRRQAEQDLDEEVRACLDLLTDQGKSSGMSEQEAIRAARRNFGGADSVKDAVRDIRAGEELQRCRQDIRYACRSLSKSRGFTIAAVLILALGIGANTAVFSIMDSVLLKPLPFSHPNQLVRIRQSLPKMGEQRLGTAPPEYASYRDRTRVFSAVAGYQEASYDVTGLSEPQHVEAAKISASLFPTLEVRPHIGRAFTRSDETPNAERVALLSYAYWARHYASDPAVLNRTIRLDALPYRIVGVMPKGFIFPSTDVSPGEPPAVWVPLSFGGGEMNDWASSFDTSVIGRLRPGMHLAQAQDDVKRVARIFQREHPDVYSGSTILQVSAEPWTPELNRRLPSLLRMLAGAVAIVLIIACANVGNLLLARASQRRREISIRRALGASNVRLARQIFSETAVLAVTGSILGCAMAVGILHAVRTLWATDLNFQDITLDGHVLLFTWLLSCLTCLVCGLLPAWAARNPDINSSLRQSGQGASTPGASRISKLLLCTEVACSMTLLITAVLLFRSFVSAIDVPLGFDPDNVLMVRTVFNGQRYASHEKRRQVERDILSQLRSLPGVLATALTTHIPLAEERQIGFVVDGSAPDQFHWADNAIVTGNYFAAMRTRLLRGRTFWDRDVPQSQSVAVINESMSHQYWPHSEAVGKSFQWGGRAFQVVGVVEDIHIKAIDEPVGPAIYFSAFQMETHTLSSGVFLMRTSPNVNNADLTAAARKAIWSVDPAVPILGVTPMREVVSASLATRRASLVLAGGFALLALVLALAGIYSVFSQAVSRRTREIGLRLALGAQPAGIRRQLLLEGARLVSWGIAAGALFSTLTGRFWSSLLFGVNPLDPATYLAGALGVLVVALLGIEAPARRASRVDPLIALREE